MNHFGLKYLVLFRGTGAKRGRYNVVGVVVRGGGDLLLCLSSCVCEEKGPKDDRLSVSLLGVPLAGPKLSYKRGTAAHGPPLEASYGLVVGRQQRPLKSVRPSLPLHLGRQ